MAKSTREKIILEMMELLEQTEAQDVKRGDKGRIELEFNSLNDGQFPILVVEPGLPQPVIKYSSRDQGVIELVRSDLMLDIHCFMRVYEGCMDKEDVIVSSMLTSLWSKLCSNPRIGDGIMISPGITPKLINSGPYSYFTINVIVNYIHDASSI